MAMDHAFCGRVEWASILRQGARSRITEALSHLYHGPTIHLPQPSLQRSRSAMPKKTTEKKGDDKKAKSADASKGKGKGKATEVSLGVWFLWFSFS